MENSIAGKSEVSLFQCKDYNFDLVRKSLHLSIEALGGMDKFVKSGQKVLIKPNLLIGRSPDKAVNTHYSVVKAVMEMVADCGGKLVVGDSPSFGSAQMAAKRCGIFDVAKIFNAPVITFKDSRVVCAGENALFHQLSLAVDALESDVVINLPKLKTHAFMTMTLGIKNLFGCVVGMEKSKWHLKAGQDPRAFARMLVEIQACVAPALTIMDGVIGMEGNGPGSGDPRRIGVILAASDTVALDRVIMEIVDVSSERLPVLQAAAELGAGKTEMSDIEIIGDSLSSVRVKGFNLPEPSFPLRRLFPKSAQKFIKRAFTNEPAFNHQLCTRCGTCAKICPPQVISFQKLSKPDKKGYDTRLIVDRSKCIHCFCCQEVCPEGAITVRRGFFNFRSSD